MTTKEYIELYEKYPSEDNCYEGWKEDLLKIKEFNKNLIEKYPWLEPYNRFSGMRITKCSGATGEDGYWPGNPDSHPDYDYEYTELDSMPRGWRLAFGDEMIDEIHRELVKFNFVNDYMIAQIKEKYGSLRWYDNGTPVGKLSDTYKEVTIKGVFDRPDIDGDNQICKEVKREHYISFFDEEACKDKSREEIEEYNRGAIVTYRVYDILEKCNIESILDKYEDLSFRTCIKCGNPAKWLTTGWISPYCDDCKKEMLKTEYFTEKSFERLKEDNI